MTTGAHIALRDAIVTALKATPALAGGRVEKRRRSQPMPQGVVEEVRVWLHNSDGKRARVDGLVYEWQTVMAVHCLARDSAGVDAETRVDALAREVSARVLGSGRLGGLAMDIELGRLTWEGEELDATTADTTLAFSIRHRTATNLT